MTITYELAKQLKDAGFPQKSVYEAPDCDCDNRYIKGCYVPTLSELIEACGEVELIKKRDAPIGNEPAITFTYEAYTEEPRLLSFISSTPEEAVAKLWLELNEGNDNRDTNRISETL